MKTILLKYLMSLTFIGISFMFDMQIAIAHGEKNLEPFVRMRSIQWYDVEWSKQQINVNEEVVITGKFHVAEDWPASLPKPNAAFLNIATPGPVLIRTERYLNGKPWVNSSALQLGGDYNFKVVLKGRVPGRYHIHPFFNLENAGQVMGPGGWLEISGNASDFSNKLTTINGEVVDMENYGLTNGVLWHLFWGVLATAWLLWWLRRPLFIPRYRMVEAGMEDELVTPQDRNISKVLLVAVPIIVLTANQITANQYSNTIPLQTGIDQILPLPARVNTEAVVIDTVKAELNVSNRSLKMRVKISNNTDKPLEIGEFTTANVRFINPNKSDQGQNLDRPLVAPEGLSLSDNTSIQPGETRELTLTAQDALWESQSLLGLINDADSHIGGLLFLYDSDGKRYITSIAAATVPIFN